MRSIRPRERAETQCRLQSQSLDTRSSLFIRLACIKNVVYERNQGLEDGDRPLHDVRSYWFP